MAASFTLPTILANIAPGNEPLSLIDGDLTTLRDPLLSLNTYSNFYTDVGAANAYAITVSSPQTVSQAAGLPIQFLAANANTGASTLQINALAVKNIVNRDGSSLSAGEIPAAGVVTVIYDGTSYQLQGSTSGINAATQAQQESASSTTVYVTPGRQQFHPSSPKAWVKADVAAGITAGYNIASLTDNGTGSVTVNLTTSFSSSSYCVVAVQQSNSNLTTRVDNTTPPAAGNFTVITLAATTGTLTDPTFFHAAAYGDQ